MDAGPNKNRRGRDQTGVEYGVRNRQTSGGRTFPIPVLEMISPAGSAYPWQQISA